MSRCWTRNVRICQVAATSICASGVRNWFLLPPFFVVVFYGKGVGVSGGRVHLNDDK